MQPIPYLFFPGTAAEALRAYARVFGAPEPDIMLMGGLPEDQRMGAPPEAVMHGAVKVDQGWIYGSDTQDHTDRLGGCVAVTQPTADESRRIFDALADGGAVIMPLAATFWSPAFGMLTDRWGTRWMIDTEGQQMPEGTSSAPPPDGQGGAVA